MEQTIRIDRRFCGPPNSGNGGYTAGLLAGVLGASADVTLRVPPPLDRDLRAVREDGRAELRDGDVVVAECHTAEIDVDPRPAPSHAEAVAASRRYPGFEEHAFPTCFVCGPEREDGLRIFAGRLPGDDLFAATWTPDPALAAADGSVREEFVWAALDCPGAFAAGFAGRGEMLLGRMAARIDRRPRVGDAHIVTAWPLGEDRRKRYAATALYDERGALLAISRQTWIVPR